MSPGAAAGALPGPLLYNTNGFPFHRLEDVLRLLAEAGYDGVALTPDVHHLDPFRSTPDDVAALRRLLDDLALSVVVETGARFVLDPGRKHRPSLLDEPPEAARRLDYLRRCVDLAVALGAPVVSTWSGAGPVSLDHERAFDRLVAGLSSLCAHAEGGGVRVGFEPEPGMFVETLSGWERVRDAVSRTSLGLALDVGHCLATRECAPQDAVARHAAEIVVLQLDDHRRGVHEHLALGEGEVDWPALASALRACGWRGPLEVELSRHGADAPATARRSAQFLRRLFSS
jgi:sugar phosphate isomerase/epimerase